MIWIVLYIVMMIIVAILCGYAKFEELSVFVTLFWPIFLAIFILSIPYFFGEYLREKGQFSFKGYVEFLKELFY